MGHRKAARSVLEGYPPSCDAWQGRAFGHASASHDPSARRETHAGRPGDEHDAKPDTSGHAQPRNGPKVRRPQLLNQRLSTELKFRTRLYQSR
jgi:hypothetical protein